MASVCIIEEDEAVRDALSALLHAYGYSVIAMADGEHLRSHIAGTHVGCIVAEAGLLEQGSVLDGPDGTRPIPVIWMTRSIRRMPESASPPPKMLMKPFSPTQLLSAISAAMPCGTC